MNAIERLARISPDGIEHCFGNVRMRQGSQILRVPEGSSIRNLTLGGGASFNSRWAALRGGVLKFGQERANIPIKIDGQGFVIPSAHTLMDEESLNVTKARNPLVRFSPEMITDIAAETLYLLHSSYCHPNDLFLPQGSYTRTIFDHETVFYSSHMELSYGVLSLVEEQMTFPAPFNILQDLGCEPGKILVKLMEGGFVSMFKYTQDQMRNL